MRSFSFLNYSSDFPIASMKVIFTADNFSAPTALNTQPKDPKPRNSSNVRQSNQDLNEVEPAEVGSFIVKGQLVTLVSNLER